MNARQHRQKLEAQRRYARTPRGQYQRHRQNAKDRGIEFLLTFDEWWHIWMQSGFWEIRGNRPGRCNMMRYGDCGPYAVGNVHIGTHRANVIERNILQRKFDAYERDAAQSHHSVECPF